MDKEVVFVIYDNKVQYVTGQKDLCHLPLLDLSSKSITLVHTHSNSVSESDIDGITFAKLKMLLDIKGIEFKTIILSEKGVNRNEHTDTNYRIPQGLFDSIGGVPSVTCSHTRRIRRF